MKNIIKLGSITNAQRSKNILESYGIRSRLIKLQNPSSSDGCGWALEINSNCDKPLYILKRNGIVVRGVEAN